MEQLHDKNIMFKILNNVEFWTLNYNMLNNIDVAL